MHCVAVCCSVFQSVLQSIAVYCSLLQQHSGCLGVERRDETHFGVVQCVAVCSRVCCRRTTLPSPPEKAKKFEHPLRWNYSHRQVPDPHPRRRSHREYFHAKRSCGISVGRTQCTNDCAPTIPTMHTQCTNDSFLRTFRRDTQIAQTISF